MRVGGKGICSINIHKRINTTTLINGKEKDNFSLACCFHQIIPPKRIRQKSNIFAHASTDPKSQGEIIRTKNNKPSG